MTTTFTSFCFPLRKAFISCLYGYFARQAVPQLGHILLWAGVWLCLGFLPGIAGAQNQKGFWNTGQMVAAPAKVQWTIGYTYPVPAQATNQTFDAPKEPLSLYPNPCIDEIFLDSPPSSILNGTVFVRIVNVSGQEVWSAIFDGLPSQTSVDVRELPPGSYTLQVIHPEHSFRQESVFVKTTDTKN